MSSIGTSNTEKLAATSKKSIGIESNEQYTHQSDIVNTNSMYAQITNVLDSKPEGLFDSRTDRNGQSPLPAWNVADIRMMMRPSWSDLEYIDVSDEIGQLCDDDDVDNQSNQEDLKDNEEEEDDSEGDSSSGGDHGLRNAAAAMVVGVGSMSDPPECQGLAHFLEHLLFMGSEKYPEENAYDSFMNKHGGSDNAYTELEYTVYHFEIPQEYLAKGLDMFAQFFTAPLMLESSVDRELNAIESEFQLVKNSDGSRLQHLMSHTCGYSPTRHPFAKFSWGNKQSLQESPRRKNVDPMVELRKFYDQVSHESCMFILQSCHRSKMSFFSTTTQQT